jgi:hypothetical protein
VRISADLDGLIAGAPLGLLARYDAISGNTYRGDVVMRVNARAHVTTYTAEIWKRLGGVWTRLIAQPLSGFAGSGTLTFECVGTGLRLYVQRSTDASSRLVAFTNDGSLQSGTVGVSGPRGAEFANFTAIAVTFIPAALPFSEDFTAEADSAIPGPSWYQNHGAFAISQHELLGLGRANVATLFGVSAADTDVQTNLLAVAGGSAGLVSRFDASTGSYYWGGLVSHGTYYTAEIHKVLGGNSFTLTTPKLLGSALGSLRLETVGTSLKLFVNGKLVAYVNDRSLRHGSVGLAGSTGSAFGSFVANSVVVTVPSLSPSFTDVFAAAADGQLSNAWAAAQGSFSTDSGVLTGQAPANLAVLNGIAAKDVSLQASLLAAPATAGAMAGLVARYNVATGNLYWGGLKYHDGAYYAEIWKRLSGGWYRLTSQRLDKNPAHSLQFDVSTANGQQLYVDGVLVGSAHDGTLTAAGTVGLYATFNVVFTSFSASEV